MTWNKKSLIRVVAACLLVCLVVSMVACVSQGGKDPTEDSATAGTDATAGDVTYTITVKSEGGLPLEKLGVYIYTDSTLQELVWFAKTGADGVVTFTDAASDSYVAVLADVPEGYGAEEMYAITGEATEIVLAADMAEGDLSKITYKLGDVMQDFSVTAPDGTVYTLSQLLQEKEAVVLNFWYLQCNPCKAEFPYLQEAYEKYAGQIEVLALNPVNSDNDEIAAFQNEQGLTFPMAAADPNWEKAMQLKAYPTTVVVDRYGNISMIHEGSVTDAETFERIFAFFTDDAYEQTVVESLEQLPELEKPGSNADDPIELGGVTSFEVTCAPGQLVYYNLYKVDKMYLSVSSADAYAVYKERTYEPSNGRFGFTLSTPDTYTPAQVVFGNSGSQDITFTVRLSPLSGSVNNPYTMPLDEQFTTQIYAGNDQGVYYTYKATEDGVLTVQCLSATEGVTYDYSLYNLSTYAMRTMLSDGDKDKDTVSINVSAGQTVQVIISTLPDKTNTYPSATMVSLATMGEPVEDEEEEEEKIVYAVTVTDENRTPVAGVFLNLTVEEKTESVSTDEEGVAVVKLPKGTYPVTMTLPKGYTANTTEFQLTETRPYLSIKLDTQVLESETYTVKVVDPDGAPLPDVLVTIDGTFGYTNEKGEASFTLIRGDYTAQIVAPDGYSAESEYAFGQGQTELTVTLKKGGQDSDDPGAEKVTYKVTVVDYSGKAQSGVLVQFLKDGKLVATKAALSSGVAEASLEPGDYTVALAFSGSTKKYYEEKKAVLSASATSLTIRVAEENSGSPVDLSVGVAYEISAGGSYVQMQSNVVNYFLFEPDVSGTYRVSTSDPDAVLSFWGSSFFPNEQSDKVDSAANTITLNVKESNLGGNYLIGVTGASDCILEIVRTGDAVLDETDMVPVVYKAETPPTPFKMTMPAGKQLTYVDITGKTGDYTYVKGSDGYYHLHSESGPILYVNLGGPEITVPYINLYKLVGANDTDGTGFGKVFRDENGVALRKEDYTECMQLYAEAADTTYGLYPLNDDLIYMIQNGGEQKGWYDGTSIPFDKVEGMNREIAWMFAVCYPA